MPIFVKHFLIRVFFQVSNQLFLPIGRIKFCLKEIVKVGNPKFRDSYALGCNGY